MGTLEHRFEGLRRSAACTQLSPDQVNDLLEITGRLVEERRHIRELLNQLPTSFGQVRGVLNELHRLVR